MTTSRHTDPTNDGVDLFFCFKIFSNCQFKKGMILMIWTNQYKVSGVLVWLFPFLSLKLFDLNIYTLKLTKERFKIKFNSMSYLDGEFLGDVIADNDDAYRYRYMSLLIKTNKMNQCLPLSEFSLLFLQNKRTISISTIYSYIQSYRKNNIIYHICKLSFLIPGLI